jgi:hypothetical protein
VLILLTCAFDKMFVNPHNNTIMNNLIVFIELDFRSKLRKSKPATDEHGYIQVFKMGSRN